MCRANGVCFLADTTRLLVKLVKNDAVRSWLNEACRLGLANSEFRTAVDCAQAASDAAPSTMTSDRKMLRTRAAETEDAPGTGSVSIATYEIATYELLA